MSAMTNTTIPATELDLPAVVDTHLAAYCEPAGVRRAALVAQVWQPQGQLLDPPFDGTGHDAIAGMTDVVLTHYPAHTFRRTTAVDAHHSFARYGWELVAPDGSVAVTGIDVIEIGDDGRLARVVGFFGALV
jgi:3',5'-cyclic AMP phosphodiesterase CpdA